MVRRLLLIGCAAVLWVCLVAASGSSQSTAIAIATVVGVILPFVLKLVPAAGHWMVAITVAAAVLVALVAEVVTGELDLSNLQRMDATAVLGLVATTYALSQLVYSTLAQSPKTAQAVV